MSNCSYSVKPIGNALEDYISVAGEGLHATDRSLWQLYVDRVGMEAFAATPVERVRLARHK